MFIEQDCKSGHGHVATFVAGDDYSCGEVANIGRHCGFMPLGPGPTCEAVFTTQTTINKLMFYVLNPKVQPKMDEEMKKQIDTEIEQADKESGYR